MIDGSYILIQFPNNGIHGDLILNFWGKDVVTIKLDTLIFWRPAPMFYSHIIIPFSLF